MPTAGIGLACSVYSSVVARRGRTTAPSRLPDQGLHRFRPAEALLKKRELMTGKMQMSGLLVALSAVALVGRAKETMAADFTVNSTVDAVDASPGDGHELSVRIPDEMKERRRGAEGDRPDELGCREQAALAEQRPELIDGHEERDEIDDAEHTLEDESREPVVGRGEPVHGAATLRAPWTRHGAPSAP